MKLLIFIILAALIFILGLALAPHKNAQPEQAATIAPSTSALPAPSTSPSPPQLVEPVAHFKERITKKRFGTYVTPQNSPVQPERFTGYHTGVDVEYGDVSSDVPVQAVASGKVIVARSAAGYGGVVVIQHTIDGQNLTAIYGHLDPANLPGVGQVVVEGQQIGILGEGETVEADGERKHLHFALHKGTELDLRGYVSDKANLEAWIDPEKIM